MKKGIAAAIVVCLNLAFFAFAYAAENSAKGKLTVNGKTVEITHAYAHNHKYLKDDKNRPLVEVLLCDGPLSTEAVNDSFARTNLVSAGKVHCVIQAINSEKKLANFEIAHNGLKMEAAAVLNSKSHLFEPKTVDGKTISGRVHTSSQQTGAFSKATYSYDITFSAALK